MYWLRKPKYQVQPLVKIKILQKGFQIPKNASNKKIKVYSIVVKKGH